MSRLIRFWNSGLNSGFGRRFSLAMFAIWVYTLLIMSLWNKLAGYIAIPLGLFGLILDDYSKEDLGVKDVR